MSAPLCIKQTCNPRTVPCGAVFDRIFCKMQKSLKQINSSERPPLRPPLWFCTRAKSPKYFKHSLPLFLLPSLSFFGAVSGHGGNTLQYIYANSPQLEWQKLVSIGINEEPDGEQADTAAKCLAKELDWQSAEPKGGKGKFNCVDPYWWGPVMGWFVPV